jgi:hypothetical protein
MQLINIRSNIINRAGIALTDAMADTTSLNMLVNSAVREMSSLRDWGWDQSTQAIPTVSGTDSYAFNTDLKKVLRVVNLDEGTIVRQITATAAIRYLDQQGDPVFWYLSGANIVFAPVPQKVINMELVYLAAPTDLSGDTDEPAIPDYAIDLVIVMAAVKVAARIDDWSRHRMLTAEVRGLQESLLDDARRAQGPPSIATRRDWARLGQVIY